MSQFINIFVAVFAALFPIVNPLGGAPIFVQMTRACTPPLRAVLARKVAVNGFILLVISMLAGSRILTFFGISLPVLRVAGGLVVTFVGWNILNQGNASADTPAGDATSEVDIHRVEEQAFYPLTMPLTMGPGSIATAVALGTQSAFSLSDGYTVLFIESFGAICGLAAVSLSVYFAYRYGSEIERLLGRNGTNVLVRLFAFILLCIGMQIMWLGIRDLVASLPPHG
ncbi:MarC family protein [Azorhizobium doebereinerae]|uniref:MarC family protein n=1 Tax=Azorhizobium doebereinerae TaxID=281091 RepID=UPI0004084220|nr:MarC family protein [Azorhizobium doebereinerae]